MSLFKRKNKTTEAPLPETEDIFFNCPLYVNVYKAGFDEEAGDEPEELAGPAAYAYLEEEVEQALCQDFAVSELHKYFQPEQTLYQLTMELVEDGLALVRAKVKKGISGEMKQKIAYFIDGQMSDGWGEELGEYFKNGEDGEFYTVSFWKYENKEQSAQ